MQGQQQQQQQGQGAISYPAGVPQQTVTVTQTQYRTASAGQYVPQAIPGTGYTIAPLFTYNTATSQVQPYYASSSSAAAARPIQAMQLGSPGMMPVRPEGMPPGSQAAMFYRAGSGPEGVVQQQWTKSPMVAPSQSYAEAEKQRLWMLEQQRQQQLVLQQQQLQKQQEQLQQEQRLQQERLRQQQLQQQQPQQQLQQQPQQWPQQGEGYGAQAYGQPMQQAQPYGQPMQAQSYPGQQQEHLRQQMQQQEQQRERELQQEKERLQQQQEEREKELQQEKERLQQEQQEREKQLQEERERLEKQEKEREQQLQEERERQQQHFEQQRIQQQQEQERFRQQQLALQQELQLQHAARERLEAEQRRMSEQAAPTEQIHTQETAKEAYREHQLAPEEVHELPTGQASQGSSTSEIKSESTESAPQETSALWQSAAVAPGNKPTSLATSPLMRGPLPPAPVPPVRESAESRLQADNSSRWASFQREFDQRGTLVPAVDTTHTAISPATTTTSTSTTKSTILPFRVGHLPTESELMEAVIARERARQRKEGLATELNEVAAPGGETAPLNEKRPGTTPLHQPEENMVTTSNTTSTSSETIPEHILPGPVRAVSESISESSSASSSSSSSGSAPSLLSAIGDTIKSALSAILPSTQSSSSSSSSSSSISESLEGEQRPAKPESWDEFERLALEELPHSEAVDDYVAAKPLDSSSSYVKRFVFEEAPHSEDVDSAVAAKPIDSSSSFEHDALEALPHSEAVDDYVAAKPINMSSSLASSSWKRDARERFSRRKAAKPIDSSSSFERDALEALPHSEAVDDYVAAKPLMSTSSDTVTSAASSLTSHMAGEKSEEKQLLHSSGGGEDTAKAEVSGEKEQREGFPSGSGASSLREETNISEQEAEKPASSIFSASSDIFGSSSASAANAPSDTTQFAPASASNELPQSGHDERRTSEPASAQQDLSALATALSHRPAFACHEAAVADAPKFPIDRASSETIGEQMANVDSAAADLSSHHLPEAEEELPSRLSASDLHETLAQGTSQPLDTSRSDSIPSSSSSSSAQSKTKITPSAQATHSEFAESQSSSSSSSKVASASSLPSTSSARPHHRRSFAMDLTSGEPGTLQLKDVTGDSTRQASSSSSSSKDTDKSHQSSEPAGSLAADSGVRTAELARDKDATPRAEHHRHLAELPSDGKESPLKAGDGLLPMDDRSFDRSQRDETFPVFEEQSQTHVSRKEMPASVPSTSSAHNTSEGSLTQSLPPSLQHHKIDTRETRTTSGEGADSADASQIEGASSRSSSSVSSSSSSSSSGFISAEGVSSKLSELGSDISHKVKEISQKASSVASSASQDVARRAEVESDDEDAMSTYIHPFRDRAGKILQSNVGWGARLFGAIALSLTFFATVVGTNLRRHGFSGLLNLRFWYVTLLSGVFALSVILWACFTTMSTAFRWAGVTGFDWLRKRKSSFQGLARRIPYLGRRFFGAPTAAAAPPVSASRTATVSRQESQSVRRRGNRKG